jgi:hypothetical protein
MEVALGRDIGVVGNKGLLCSGGSKKKEQESRNRQDSQELSENLGWFGRVAQRTCRNGFEIVLAFDYNPAALSARQ